MIRSCNVMTGFTGRTAFCLLSALVISLSIFQAAVFAATSCSPGLASVIGTEYVADKCPWEGSTFNYYTTDLQCIDGSVQRDPNSSGDMYYQNVAPQAVHNFLVNNGPYYSMKIFRDTPGMRFVAMTRYFANGGKIDGKSMTGYPSAPTMNYDVFDKVLYKNPNAVVPCCLRITSFAATPRIINPSKDETTTIQGAITSNYPVEWTLNFNGNTLNGSGTSANLSWNGKDSSGNIVAPGEYIATLTATSGGCTDTKFVTVLVITPAEDHKKEVCYLSTADVVSGSLRQQEMLFSAKGGSLATSLNLTYDSFDLSNGTLGQGWRHNFDHAITVEADSSAVLRKGNVLSRYKQSNGVYQAEEGDFTELAKNADSSFTITEKSGVKEYYDATGRLTVIADPNGNSQTLAYDATGRLSTITDPAGRTTAFAYDGSGRIATITDTAGNVYTFGYSGTSLTSITWPDESKWQYAYDSEGYMISKTDPLGNNTVYTYDSRHRVVQGADPDGKSKTITYPTDSSQIRNTTLTDKDGGVWTYRWDSKNLYITGKSDPLGNSTGYSYDIQRNVIQQTDPDGGITMFTYDAKGNVLTITDPRGKTTIFTYNSLSRVTSITDPLGRVTTNTYDEKGNLKETVDPLGAKTTYIYDTKGYLTRIVNARNQSTALSYDSYYNLKSITDAMGNTTGFSYDVMGNMLFATDPAGKVTRYEYDNRNRLASVTDALGNKTSYSYDVMGNVLKETDANGNATRYEYNFLGQTTKSTDALDKETLFVYGTANCSTCSGVNQLTTLADANGNITRYQYGLAGRLDRETDPKGLAVTYQHDTMGRVISRTDANDKTITYTYDKNGRITARNYADGTSDTFIYDDAGNMLNAANGNTSYTMNYDMNNRLIDVTDSLGRKISYQYDVLGNRTRMTAPDGKITTYTYDADNRLTYLVYGAKVYALQYDTLGRRTRLLNPNTTYATYSFDDSGNMTGMWNRTSQWNRTAPNTVITSHTHTYDKIGNRLSKTEPFLSYSYIYDPVYRLLASTASTPALNEAYTYDPVGNRLAGPTTAASYSYAAANELSARAGATYQYDGVGNMISKTEGGNTYTYTWDAANRLTSVSTPTGTVSFKYDPFGRRIEKSTQTKTTTYFHDDENVINEYENGALTTKYVQNLSVDDPFAMERNGILYAYHKDTLGSVTAITDNTGAIVQAYGYDSFGNIVSRKNSNFIQPYTYTGRELDEETGLYYYRARYYDLQTGRFLSRDPISFAGGDVNLYGYVQQNPVNWIDPWGLSKFKKRVWKIGGYEIEKVKGDTFHGGEHYHVRRLGALQGKVALEGTVVEGSIGKKLLKCMRERGLIRGLGWLAIGLSAYGVYDSMTAEGPKAFENFLETISVLPEKDQGEALEKAYKTHPELFERN